MTARRAFHKLGFKMKKILSALIFILIAAAATAESYIGGGLLLSAVVNSDDETSDFAQILPGAVVHWNGFSDVGKKAGMHADGSISAFCQNGDETNDGENSFTVGIQADFGPVLRIGILRLLFLTAGISAGASVGATWTEKTDTTVSEAHAGFSAQASFMLASGLTFGALFGYSPLSCASVSIQDHGEERKIWSTKPSYLFGISLTYCR